jgi:esterase/lipase
VSSTDKQQLILERGGHIVTEDYDKEIAFAAIDQFLQQHA